MGKFQCGQRSHGRESEQRYRRADVPTGPDGGNYTTAPRGSFRNGRRDAGGKPGTYGGSPDKLVGPTGRPGGQIDGEAITEAKGIHQVGRSRGRRSDPIQNPVQPGVNPQIQPRPRQYQSDRRETSRGKGRSREAADLRTSPKPKRRPRKALGAGGGRNTRGTGRTQGKGKRGVDPGWGRATNPGTVHEEGQQWGAAGAW